MELLSYLAYVLIGILSGLIAGLLGVSGGLVTVPLLALLFHFMGLPQAYLMHLAIGTSLAAMVFTAISSSIAHHLKGAVLWDLIKVLFPGLLVGALLGALIARFLSSVILELLFGLFAVGMGIYFYKDHFRIKTEIRKLPRWHFMLWGFAIAGLSTILGVGGGIFAVPLLVSYHYPEKKAIGTSAALGMIVSFLGALSYLWLSRHESIVPHAIGYLFLPAFIAISIASVCAAPFGAKWAHQLPEKKLRALFGIFLVVAGLLMVF